MLFNSIEYLFFLPIVFIIYWSLANKLFLQNIFILTASYFFYGLWDYKFLGLIVISSLVDYLVGISLAKSLSSKIRAALLSISILVNIGLLFVFKYHNFFIDSFVDLCGSINYQPSISSLNIILPVGISFYTFQTLSYSIDVYKRKLEPTKNILNFFTYVAFFPQLVAGPIERAINLLPQIEAKRTFNFTIAVLAMRQILWGLFKKVAIADNCALIVDPIFSDPSYFGSLDLISGAILFAFQIYCDFSGYSDIAIGTANLLGIKLMQNFSFPYFSRDIAEFWRKWHISLSTWFRDYVYIPLGGSKVSKILQLRNIFIIFLISGFWHGPSWKFIFWGFIHSLCYVPLLLLRKNRQNIGLVAEKKIFPTFIEFYQILNTFCITTMAWIFFRARSIEEGFIYIKSIFTKFNFNTPFLSKIQTGKFDIKLTITFILTMIIVEWLNRSSAFGLEKLPKYKGLRYIIYIILSLITLQYLYGENEFIYFQF